MGSGTSRSFKSYPLTFSRGIDQSLYPPAAGKSGVLTDAKNMRVVKPGSIEARGGDDEYQTGTLTGNEGVGSLHRYMRSDGDGRIFLSGTSGDYAIQRDDDDGAFSDIDTPDAAPSDGKTRIIQWGDAMMWSHEHHPLSIYNHNGDSVAVVEYLLGSPTVPYYDMSGATHPTSWTFPIAYSDDATHPSVVSGTAVSPAGTLPATMLAWIFTLDIYVDGVFLGETHPINIATPGTWQTDDIQDQPTDLALRQYHMLTIDNTGGDGYQKATFKRNDFSLADYGPSDCAKFINVYRQFPFVSDSPYVKHRSSYWVGYMDYATVAAASYGETIFVDDGSILKRQVLFDNTVFSCPRARFMEIFKGRMVYAHVGVQKQLSGAVGAEDVFPDRVWFSMLFAPLACPDLAFHDFKSQIPGIMGIKNYMEELLLVFKADKVFRVSGADTNISGAVPAISVGTLTEAFGCTSNESITKTEQGILVWWSHTGPVYWDGTNPVTPFMAQNVKDFVDYVNSEAAAGQIVGSYNPLRRELTFYLSGSYTNAKDITYSFVTRTWTNGTKYTSIGDTCFVPDGAPKMLLGRTGQTLTSYAEVIEDDAAATECSPGGAVSKSVTTGLFNPTGDESKDFILKEIFCVYRASGQVTVTVQMEKGDGDGTYQQVDLTAPVSGDSSVDQSYIIEVPGNPRGKMMSVTVSGAEVLGEWIVHYEEIPGQGSGR